MGASHWQPWENLFLHEVSNTMPFLLSLQSLSDLNQPSSIKPGALK